MTLRSDNAYLVLGCKPWNRRIYNEMLAGLPGNWQFIGSREEFALDVVRKMAPRYIFFLHWSWQVPSEIVDDYECVCFHMTDVPYGRGGSPLQNLILRDHRETKLTALRMTGEIDAGPVYFKESLSLEGNAEEIYLRATRLSATLIKRFMNERPKPSAQDGEVVTFTRRKPQESRIGPQGSLDELHDFIRMLDAEGYPRAFLEHAGFRLEFSRSSLYDGRIVADVKILKVPEDGSEK